MKTLRKLAALVLFACCGQSLLAQQEAMFTHYMNNTLAVNPAYAGSRDALTVTALHRSQWVNFDGAPTTQTVTMHTPLFNNKLGLGVSVIHDQIGPVKTTSAYVDLAYIIKTSEKGHLAFGLKGGFNYMQANLSTLKLDQTGDVAFSDNINSRFLPNFGFGIYYYLPRFYVGISTPQLMENNFKANTTTGSTNLASEQRHYYLIAGTVFKLSNTVELKPTAYVKVTMNAPVEADVTASFIFSKKVLIGAMVRTGDALGVLVGYNITDQFHVGYSFDWSYGNRTFKYNQGSHEVVLVYDFIFKDKQRIRSPRYF